MRVTCTGTLYMCLGHEDAADLRTPLRASEGNDLLNAAIREAIARKPKGELVEARRIAVMDNQLSDPGLEQSYGDGAASGASAHQKRPRSLDTSTTVSLGRHEGQAIQHVTVPGAVRITSDYADGPSSFARVALDVQCLNASNLCGIVTSNPSTFRMR